MPTGVVETAFRVAVAAFVIVGPTVLFLLLLRGLEAMQDEDLIRRVERRAEQMDSGSDIRPAQGALTAAMPTGEATLSEGVACDNCGTRNRSGVTYCRECLAELE